MTVVELIERIEAGYVVGAPTTTALAVTGERYVRIGAQTHPAPKIPGTVEEFAEFELGFDEETACWAALSCFETYAEDRGTHLYWRQKPVLEWNDAHNRCHIYMRCLVTFPILSLVTESGLSTSPPSRDTNEGTP